MYKIKLICFVFLNITVTNSFCQIFHANFQTPIPIIFGAPPGITGDMNWYSFDQDSLPDGSGEGRPGGWYKRLAFASIDSLSPLGDSNFVMASNSEFLTPGKNRNWLITPSIDVNISNPFLSWHSAPFSTPFKLDGYKILISTTTNDTSAFTDTVWTAAEYSGPGNVGGDFSLYNFSPTGEWVHGWNGVYVVPSQVEATGDSSQLKGILTYNFDHIAACDFYPFQSIYIAFVHDSYDDNQISIDEIKVDGCEGIKIEADKTQCYIHPNPFSNQFSVDIFNPKKPDNLYSIQLVDLTGKILLIKKASSFNTILDLATLSQGMYTLSLYENGQRVLTNKVVKE